jgi:16S rRNA (cytosine967-C5)-methyltransferase
VSVAANQLRTFLRIAAELRPHCRRDPALPARLKATLAAHKEFGSRDRRLYRELSFTAWRYLPWIEPLLETASAEAARRLAWLCHDLPATKLFRAAFATGEPPGGDLAECLPDWFRGQCPEIFAGEELAAQFRRAPLWLRLQTTDVRRVTTEWEKNGWAWRPSLFLPQAFALAGEVDITRTRAWETGLVEVQDLGSQLVLESGPAASGQHWLDACAGAGGKTLQLARMVGATGRVDAHDIRPAALAELRSRAARARLPNVRTVARPDAAGYDGVLVDAPCSGSGTWRRAPHLKWTTTPGQIEAEAARQTELLAGFSAHVRPGGRLVYATCSLSRRENAGVVSAFLAGHPGFQIEPAARDFGYAADGGGLVIRPALHDTDGFFVAHLRRR